MSLTMLDEWVDQLEGYRERLDRLADHEPMPEPDASPDRHARLSGLRRRQKEIEDMIRVSRTSPGHLVTELDEIARRVADLGQDLRDLEGEDA